MNHNQPIDDNGPYFNEILSKKKNLEANLEAIYNKRTSEQQIASQNLEDMYHQIVRNIISLYKSSDERLNADLFREVADGLVKMHKLVRKKINESYSMSFQEGIYSFLLEFIQSLPRNILLNENAMIHTNTLHEMLSQPGDPDITKRGNQSKRPMLKVTRRHSFPSIMKNGHVNTSNDNLKRSMGNTSSDEDEEDNCNLSRKRNRLMQAHAELSTEDEENSSSSDTSGDNNSISPLSLQFEGNRQRPCS